MSFGAIGYPDGQRQTSWDDAVSAWDLAHAQVSPVVSPPINVSRYGYTFFRLYILTGVPLQVNFVWYLDQALSMQTAKRVWQVDPNVNSTYQALLPNMGVWLQVSLIAETPGADFSCSAHTLVTNRAHPLQVFPITEPIFFYTGTLAPGGTQTLPALSYSAGPAQLRLFGGSQGCRFDVQYLNIDYSYYSFYSQTVAANAIWNDQILLPPSATQVVLTNQSAIAENDTADIICLASLTGG